MLIECVRALSRLIRSCVQEVGMKWNKDGAVLSNYTTSKSTATVIEDATSQVPCFRAALLLPVT